MQRINTCQHYKKNYFYNILKIFQWLFVNKEEIKCERENCIERKIKKKSIPTNKILNEKIKNKIISRKQKKTDLSQL